MKPEEKDSKPNAIQAALSYVLSHARPAVRLISEGISGINERPKRRQASALMLVMAVIVCLVFFGPLGSLSPTSPAPVLDKGADSYTIDPVPDDATTDGTVDVPGDDSPAEPADSQTITVPDGSSMEPAVSQTTTSVTTKPPISTSSTSEPPYTISVSPGAHGSISPDGTLMVTNGSSQSFTIVPDAGYRTSDVVVDGSSVGAVNSYTFTNLNASHTIAASFVPETSHTIWVIPDAHTSISPDGTLTVADGSSQSFTIAADAGYRISSVIVDGSSVGAVNSYTFTNLNASHSIAAYSAAADTTPPYTPPAQDADLVIAACNSSYPQGADYFCDGWNDEVQINAAIAQLSSGGVIQLLDGTFFIGADSHVSLTSNVTVRGQGPALTTVYKPESWGSQYVFYGDSYGAPHANVTLADMTIDIGSQNSYTNPLFGDHMDGLLFSNIQAVSSSRYGLVYIQHSDHMQLLGCVFDGVRVHISGSTGYNSGESIDSEDVLVQGCTFKNMPYDNPEEFALGNTVKNFRILNNTFLDCPHMAIDTCNSVDVLVSGNYIDGACLDRSWDGAIYSEGGSRVTITNNRVTNCPISAGISVSYMILGYGSGGDILIDGNVVTNTYLGIAVLGIPRVTISNNQISGTAWHGILVEPKTVYDVTYYPDNCKVIGNRISDFGKTVSYASGVQINNCWGSEVRSNVIDGYYNGNAVYGIRESGSADYSTITQNTISGVRNGIGTVGGNTAVWDNSLG
jgi:hypothetical protein